MRDKKIFKKINGVISADITTIFLLIILFSTIYSFIGIQKHNHFQTFAWDTSFFVQALYFINKLEAPYNSLNKMNIWGDHFNIFPVVLTAIFYKLWSNPNILFITQAVVGSFSAFPLYLLTKQLLKKTKISPFGVIVFSLVVCFVYLFSVSFQAMMADEFHNEPIAALPLIFLIYFIYSRKSLGYWVSLALLMFSKEIFSLLAVPIGIYIFLVSKETKKAIITATIGAVFFYLLIARIMPALAGTRDYLHFAYGNQPDYIITKFINNPTLLFSEFFDHPKKIETIQSSLFSFGFLPLLSPQSMVLPISSLAIRFYDDSTPRLYEFNNHYAVPFIPFMAVGASFGLYRLITLLIVNKRYNPEKIWPLLAVLLLSFSLFQDFYYHGAINSLFKRSFYQTLPWEQDAHDLITRVPPNVTIASQNSLLPHLSQRDNFYLLPEVGDAEFIAVDLTEGPNKFSPLVSSKEMKVMINNLIREKKYNIIWQKGKSILLQQQPGY